MNARVTIGRDDDAVRVFDLPHSRARALLATGAPVYLSVNPVEFHGPHLSLHNDLVVSRALSIVSALMTRFSAARRNWFENTENCTVK